MLTFIERLVIVSFLKHPVCSFLLLLLILTEQIADSMQHAPDYIVVSYSKCPDVYGLYFVYLVSKTTDVL